MTYEQVAAFQQRLATCSFEYSKGFWSNPRYAHRYITGPNYVLRVSRDGSAVFSLDPQDLLHHKLKYLNEDKD